MLPCPRHVLFWLRWWHDLGSAIRTSWGNSGYFEETAAELVMGWVTLGCHSELRAVCEDLGKSWRTSGLVLHRIAPDHGPTKVGSRLVFRW